MRKTGVNAKIITFVFLPLTHYGPEQLMTMSKTVHKTYKNRDILNNC